MKLRILIVSPHFVPVNAPDMQRVRMSLPAFVAAGCAVTVLTVADPTPVAPLEPELSATVPAAVVVERVRCWSRAWTGRLGVNNPALRALPFLFLTGCRLLLTGRYDVVYFSTTMFSVLPLGRLWRMFCGVPFVVDLQDPWVTDFYASPGAPPPPGGWKYRIVDWLGRRLEGWTLSGAAQLIAVSSGYIAEVRARHPRLQRIPATILPFGSPDPDLQFLRQQRPPPPPLLPAGDGVRLVFAGALGPGMLAPIEVLFAALEQLRAADGKFSVHFFGTSYAAAGEGRPATLALAARYGLRARVHEQTDRLGYRAALQVMQEADALLLLGSTALDFTPSKLVTVLASGRPVLALAPAGSALVARLTEFGEPCIVIPERGTIAESIHATMVRLAAIAAGSVAAPDPAHLADYSAAALALRQLAVLAAAGRSA